jgi:hypothetical protein
MMLWLASASAVIILGGFTWFRLRGHRTKRGTTGTQRRQTCDAPEKIRACLIPLTDKARAASLEKNIPIGQYPFRVGRECRMHIKAGNQVSAERSKTGAAPNNDLYLQDNAEKMQISREHFQIEQRADGGFDLVDRGSACGTRVGKRTIPGGDRGGRCELKHGDTITIGIKSSPYVFRFVVQD